jgi:hypothetical protein
MKSKLYLLGFAVCGMFLSCKKDEPVTCDEDTLEINLLEFTAAQAMYEDDPTGSNCLELRKELEEYLAEAAKCGKDVSSAQDALNNLPCGPNTVYNDTFWMAWHCNIDVASYYKHNSQLDSFYASVQMLPDNFVQPLNNNFYNDNSFDSTTDHLQPGQKYRIVLYELLHDVYVEECVNFIKREGGLLTSIQGLTLAMMKQTTCIAARNANVEHRILKFFSPDYRSTMYVDNNGNVGLPVVENQFVNDFITGDHFTWDCKLYNFDIARGKGQYLLVYFDE